jgi:hypothetical protein
VLPKNFMEGLNALEERATAHCCPVKNPITTEWLWLLDAEAMLLS